MNPPGYDYAVFCANVAALHGPGCWVQRMLAARDGRTVPFGWLTCDGVMDAHHCLPKQLLKREFPHGTLYKNVNVGPSTIQRKTQRTLDALLNDGRNGVPVCRKHHDMIEGRQLVIRRYELPAATVAFAGQLGLGWYLESRAFDQPEAMEVSQ